MTSDGTPDPRDCWIWAGGTYSSGHGVIHIGMVDGKYRSVGAHVVMYENFVGPVPDGTEVDHLCETPPCVNPAHLEAVTHRENTLRHYRRRSHCKHGHEFTPENVRWKTKVGNISSLNPTGKFRVCRECIRANNRRDRAKR